MEQQRIGSPGGSFDNPTGTSNAGPSLNTGNTQGDSSTMAVAKEQGQRALDKLRQNAISKVEDQKSAACEQVEQLANGLRRTGETLQQEGAEPFGQLATTAADKVQRVGNYLQRNDVDDLLRDLGTFARRNPTAVFGAALFCGVLVGRFLRSSTPSPYEVEFQPDPSLLDPGSNIGSSSIGSPGLGTSGLGSGMGSTGIGSTGVGSTGVSTGIGSTGVGSTGSTGLGSDGQTRPSGSLGTTRPPGSSGEPPTGGWS